MIYNREEFARRQTELKNEIGRLDKYFNKEVMDYLYSLVNLEETILKDTSFLDEFGDLGIIFSLMKFNITGRIYNIVDNDGNLFQDRIRSNNSIDTPKIQYEKPNAISFDIISADFRKKTHLTGDIEQKPRLILKKIDDKSLEDIEFVESSIVRRNEYLDQLQQEKPKFSLFQFRDGNMMVQEKIKNEKDEIERLRIKLAYLEKYGHLESLICNDVTNLVLNDLHIKENELTRSVNKSLIKRYKYIDVVERLR